MKQRHNRFGRSRISADRVSERPSQPSSKFVCLDEVVDSDGSVRPRTEFGFGNYPDIKAVADQHEYTAPSSSYSMAYFCGDKGNHGFLRVYAPEGRFTQEVELHFMNIQSELMRLGLFGTDTVYTRLKGLEGIPDTEYGVGNESRLKQIAESHETACEEASQFILIRCRDADSGKYGFGKVFYQGQMTPELARHVYTVRENVINGMLSGNPGAKMSCSITPHGIRPNEALEVLRAHQDEKQRTDYKA